MNVNDVIVVFCVVLVAICSVGVAMAFLVWRRLTDMIAYLATVEDDTRVIRQVEEASVQAHTQVGQPSVSTPAGFVVDEADELADRAPMPRPRRLP